MALRLAATSSYLEAVRDEAAGRAVAGAVVGDAQVVVDGLRDVEATHLVALLLRLLVDDVRRLRAVVAADVEEVADVEGLQKVKFTGLVQNLGRL